MSPTSSPSTPPPRRPVRTAEPEALPLGDWLADLWSGRWLILGCTAVFTLGGGFLIWRATPIFQAESILQLKEKPGPGQDTSAVSKLDATGQELTEPGTEVEILKTDLILGRTVQALDLDLRAEPKLLPLIGAPLIRGRADAPILDLETLKVPERLNGKVFRVTALPGGAFQWSSPSGAPLAIGRPGEEIQGLVDGDVVRLKVKAMTARPGQVFRVFRKPLPAAIADLRRGFDASERGKGTNVLALTFRGPHPVKTANILNAIVNQYIQYKLDKRTGDATKTRALLEAKMAPLKASLDAAEARLNAYRTKYGSVDLSKEAETLLLQGANLNSQITALEQKKQETLRTYKENADVVVTMNKQIEKLKAEAAGFQARMRSLPSTQQEVVRLSRDVQVNTELYTALMNSVQQLQVTGAADVGAIAIVVPAAVNPEPIGARGSVLLAFYASLGFMAGIALTVLRHLLHPGIKDHRLVESKLGIPVLVTVPHSRDQEGHARSLEQRRKGVHLLAYQNADDLAVESLRSLRTSLLFMLRDKHPRTLMVTGPSPGVGKSFLSTNLALILTQTGTRVLLVDADLRRGILHAYFGLPTRQGGLSDVLTGRAPWRELVKETAVAGLDVLPTGLIPGDSAKLLLTETFRTFVEEAGAAYDYVIFDVPPLLPVTDAILIGAFMETTLLVAKFGKTSLDELAVCQQRLEAHEIKVAGCIFNDIEPLGLGYGHQDYTYAYHYKYK
ncbi:polysaccharide biosynthesis tyrosine autokinase [Mesoterricola sediminis]|uniref:Tyrosine-protein kinase involved in EPS biosynthesis n=1 Tax=Mesoterricola sediminis TaxID=2927980 RepID=A0AA48KEY5_9BACT|nr:polysaccharide biosynthesis tyrosine autokinase [Mesoterricola sediminis]BDU75923.1 tyrosine-protein kinase involved in EPS biosynthesis [Mesoterricola sediminis]